MPVFMRIRTRRAFLGATIVAYATAGANSILVGVKDIDADDLVSAAIDVLVAERKKRNLSQNELSKLCGLHRSTIGLFEGKKRSPSLFVFQRIAGAMRYPLSKAVAEAERKVQESTSGCG